MKFNLENKKGLIKIFSYPIVKFIGSVVLLYLIFLRLDFNVIKNSLTDVSYGILLIALLINIIAEILCIERHKLIIYLLGGEINRWTMTKVYFKGVLTALFIPAGTEITKWVMLRSHFSINKTKKSGVSILIDRGLGVIGLLFALIIGLLFAIKIINLKLLIAILMATIVGIFAIFIVLNKIMVNYPVKNKTKILFLGIIYSIIYQIMVSIITILLIGAISGFNFNYLPVLFIMPIVSLISLLPITVSGLGLRELSLASFSVLIGVKSEILVITSLFIWGFLVVESLIGWYFYATKD